MRRVSTGMSTTKAGLIALVLVVVGTYFAFTKSVPFRSHHEIQAVFMDRNLLEARSPVRIAGVDVGTVTEVGRYKDTNMSVVTMRLDDQALPLHKDATVKVRPRLFLEGNFYADLSPGTPNSPILGEGDVLPVTQTSMPVQLDQLLTALQGDTRRSLQETLQGLGEALDSEPTAAEDARQDPAVAGMTGGEALNETLRTSPDALRGTAIVLDGLRGTEPHDLSRMIGGFARATTALAENQDALGSLVSDFNTTMATMADHGDDLSRTVALLGPTAANAQRAFAQLDTALPVTRAFATAMTASVRELPATIAAAEPWLAQARPLLGQAELGGLLDELSPAVSDLARLTHETLDWMPRIDAFNRCITDVILPTGNIKVQDGEHSLDVENYKQFWYAMVGQAGEGQNFDGNGPLLRIAAPGGGQTIKTGKTNYADEALFGNVTLPPLRTSPAYSNKVPPLRRDVPCHTSPVPDVNGPASVGPADGSAPDAPAPSEAAVGPAPAKAAGG